MADAALPALREVLTLPAPVRSEPLPPPQKSMFPQLPVFSR
jgi:hypothetical protein